ncbi:hypothetical protein JCM16814_22710 [Desulfobaculum senezii]
MASSFSVFELEKRKWELARNQREGRSPADGAQDTGGSSPEERTEQVTRLHAALLEVTGRVRSAVRAGNPPPVRDALRRLRDVVSAQAVRDVFEYASLDEEHLGADAAMVFVALAAMKVGMGLGYEDKRLLWLGLGGMCANIGLYRIPRRLEGVHPSDLSPQDRAKKRTHPHLGGQVLERLGEEYRPLAEIVLQVHERVDGSGYPHGLKGKEIHEMALIIGLVEHVVSMRRPRRSGNRFLQTTAIKEVVDSERLCFPHRVLKEFLDQVSLFPVNTYVRLNNDSVARVLATYKDKPMRPTLELLYDGRGKKKDAPRLVHLEHFPLLHIVDALESGVMEEMAAEQTEEGDAG